jgi:hypothetical protein
MQIFRWKAVAAMIWLAYKFIPPFVSYTQLQGQEAIFDEIQLLLQFSTFIISLDYKYNRKLKLREAVYLMERIPPQ